MSAALGVAETRGSTPLHCPHHEPAFTHLRQGLPVVLAILLQRIESITVSMPKKSGIGTITDRTPGTRLQHGICGGLLENSAVL